nr:PilZ domain-containing protein [uncultured Desulfobacter sp.]
MALNISDKDDRRKFSRVIFTTKITIHMLDESGQDVHFKAHSKDLSQKGVFVKTDKRPSLESACQVNVYLSGGIDDIKLEIQGRIVRHTQSGFAVEFKSMDVDTYTHLKTLILYNIEGSD